MSQHTAAERERPVWVEGAVVIALAAIEAALLYKLIAGGVAAGSAEVMAAISLVAILLLLTGKVEGLKSIAFGKEGFKAEALERLERRTDNLEREIAQLALSSMGDDAYLNLRKLAGASFGPYRLEPHMGLHTELYHLRNLGFVALREDKVAAVNSIHQIPEQGDELSDYIEVTDIGRRYIELRRRSDMR